MITDQPTQTTPLRPRARAAAALARLLGRHPHLADNPVLNAEVKADGTVSLYAGLNQDGGIATMREIAQKFGAELDAFRYTHQGIARVSLNVDADFDGVHWNAHAYVDAAAYDFDAFTRDHSADPQEWTDAERAEYKALAGSAAAA